MTFVTTCAEMVLYFGILRRNLNLSIWSVFYGSKNLLGKISLEVMSVAVAKIASLIEDDHLKISLSDISTDQDIFDDSKLN